VPVSGALRRLLGVRNLEEEQHRASLESALAELHALEHALALARARERGGRARVSFSASDPDPAGRIAALVESSSAARHAAALAYRISAAEQEADRLRRQFLLKRLERRQAETLIREEEARDTVQAERRAQQHADDWFSSRAERGKASPRNTTARPSDKKL